MPKLCKQGRGDMSEGNHIKLYPYIFLCIVEVQELRYMQTCLLNNGVAIL